MELRPYQQQAKDAIFSEWENGVKKTLLVLPTGCGKTIVFAKVAEECVKGGSRVLILAHRGELLDQAADKIGKSTGLGCATEKAEQTCLGSWFRIVVGSVQSMMREKRLNQFPNDYFNTIIIDEAHHCISDSYQKVLRHFPDAEVLGVTATPDRGDMQNLGTVFESLAYEYTLPKAIKEGYLSPIKAVTIGLQVFAAPNNLTGEVQIEVKAREIDFVTSFGKNLKALLDILGITRMIRKENNSVLKTKTVKGELQSGDVGEGEEIPMSRYTVEEKPFDTIKIEKYRKGVSLEAISEKGYEAAVQDTDDEFKSDLQNVVTDKFYAQLKAGSLTGYETTWQMAVAMAIGKVVAKFQKMKRTATGVAVWVNTLDVYKYLGAADITLQTAFGFKYLTNFLGADVVFVTSEVPQNVVIATPLNNMIAYYVDPGDSDFAKAGLEFTTDSETGFIGFHSEGTYSRMISDNYAIMGLRLFCEYLDAIAYISVGESDTQTLGTLNVTSEAGSEAGTTRLTVKEQLMSMRNCWKYKDAAAATAVTYGMDVKNWSKWDGESEIASTATHHITLVECDQNYKAVRSGDVTVTVNPGA